VIEGSWGQSQISLAAHAGPGDSIRLRFDFGADGCTGLDGWYVDNVLVCTDVVTAGRVPDGGDVPGSPLTVGKTATGEIALSWDPSCHVADTDYEIYEGTVGDFTSHESRFCTNDGATTRSFAPDAGDRYFLVVPRNADREGSYGEASSGDARPQGVTPCLVQALFPGCG
jgi:hypothetical protein